MPQRKRKTPVPSGMSAKQMKRRKPIGIDHLKTIEPLTTNQEKVFTFQIELKDFQLFP